MSDADPHLDSTPGDRAIAAGDWVARRDRGMTAGESAAFQAWLAADPANAAEFERMAGTWAKLESLGQQLEAGHLSVVEDNPLPRRLVRIGAPLLAAAAIAVAFVLLRQPHAAAPGPTAAAPSTVPAQRATYTVERTAKLQMLPDGSVVDLRGDSSIEFDSSDGNRRVNLTGEAFFAVAKDSAHPFLVSAGGVTVRALGTAFDVRSDAGQSQVILTEGKVRVDAGDASREVDLVPGQRATIDRGQTAVAIDQPATADLARALDWRATRLVFDDTPWSDVTAAFNRFNARKLQLKDDSLRGQTLTGPFRADNLDGFLNLERRGAEIDFEDSGTDLILIKAAH